MSIDMAHFTPLASFVGGLLIGGAAGLYLLGAGRIAGISGTVGGVLRGATAGSLRGQGARIAFIAGMLMLPWLWMLFRPLPEIAVGAGGGAVILAGLLVGVGTRMGNGCTSGHGICGLSRGSLRSLVYVLTFMVAGFATTFLLRHVL